MPLESRILLSSPHYWTAAVYKQQPGGGWKMVGYTPVAKLSYGAMLDRMITIKSDLKTLTYPFYWDGQRWVREHERTTAPRLFGGEVSIGTLERRSPLPPGRYWQDIFEKQARDWNDWVIPNIDTGKVKVLKAEHFKADPLRDGSWLPDVLAPDSPGKIAERSWFLFEVLAPVDWPAIKLGFPTVATPDVLSSSDTALNPPGPSPLDEIGDGIKSALLPVAGLAGLYLGLKLVLALRK